MQLLCVGGQCNGMTVDKSLLDGLDGRIHLVPPGKPLDTWSYMGERGIMDAMPTYAYRLAWEGETQILIPD